MAECAHCGAAIDPTEWHPARCTEGGDGAGVVEFCSTACCEAYVAGTDRDADGSESDT